MNLLGWTLLSLMATVEGIGYHTESTLVWDESTMGDLPDGPEGPQPLGELGMGSSIIVGMVGDERGDDGDGQDAAYFIVPEGYYLTNWYINKWELADGSDGNIGWFHITENVTLLGPQVTLVDQYLGGIIFNSSQIGDVLPLLSNATELPLDELFAVIGTGDLTGLPPLGTGFDIPLGPGPYTFVLYSVASDAGDEFLYSMNNTKFYELEIVLEPAT
mmetsp:Transcript_10540/g.33694  ORF Transcript_10540/g.33694 Transcript_10540/m.33694 type:complete len:217 (+) Transcript_10540:56-706(+)